MAPFSVPVLQDAGSPMEYSSKCKGSKYHVPQERNEGVEHIKPQNSVRKGIERALIMT